MNDLTSTGTRVTFPRLTCLTGTRFIFPLLSRHGNKKQTVEHQKT